MILIFRFYRIEIKVDACTLVFIENKIQLEHRHIIKNNCNLMCFSEFQVKIKVKN